MRFQIILPTYNASRWFEQALSSVSGHPEGEVLVIDDGSSGDERDKIAEICSAYPSVRFFPEPHRGLVGTLNFALSIATAPYIARMDADDVSLPGRFDKQIAFLNANPRIAVVGGQMIGIDHDGNLNGRSTNFPISPEAIANHLAKARNPFMHPSVMMRLDVIRELGGYRAATQYAEDYDLWLRLAERVQLANLDELLIQYRRHDDQITRSKNWEQKFARDLATMSAKSRRAGKPDPIASVDHRICLTHPREEYGPEILHLISAYQAIYAQDATVKVSGETIAWILTGIKAGYMGQSSKPQAVAAAQAAKLAWQESNLLLAMRALGTGMRRNPLACFTGLIS